MLRTIFSVIWTVLVIGAVLFWLQFAWLVNYKFFAPKYEDARRDVFENTQSYIQGKRQELNKYRLEYMRAKDPLDKEAIKMMILHSMANIDKDKLDYEERAFLNWLYGL